MAKENTEKYAASCCGLSSQKSKTLEKGRDSEEAVEGRLAFQVQRITHCRSRGVRGLLKLGETQAGGGEARNSGKVSSCPAS